MLKLTVTPKLATIKVGETAQFTAALVAVVETRPRRDQGGEQRAGSKIINESFSGIYRIPLEEVAWLEDNPRKTRADYAKFKNAPPPPAPEVEWTVDSGSIDKDGLFTAPATAGTAIVTATSVADPNDTDTAEVTFTEDAATKATWANPFSSKPDKVVAPTVPLTPIQMQTLKTAGIPADSPTAVLTSGQLAALVTAGVPATLA